jgi:thioredoxin reductase (NADPH)
MTEGPPDVLESLGAAPAVIVGAGPAGISAALWLRRLHVPLRLLDRASAAGGELHRINLPIEDYPGLPVPDGRVLVARFADHLAAASIHVETGVEVIGVDLPGLQLRTSSGGVPFAALVVATGLVRRRLGVPGEDDHRGRGVSYSATTDLAAIAGREAIVVGAGDGAFENAAILAGSCPRVTLVIRGHTPRARPALVARCRAAPNVTVLTGYRALAVLGDGRSVTGLRVMGPSGERVLAAHWIVVKVGFAPVTDFLEGQIALDPKGYIRVDRAMRASAPGVFAAGDVANAIAPSIASAVGDGAIAARGVLAYLLTGGPATGGRGALDA